LLLVKTTEPEKKKQAQIQALSTVHGVSFIRQRTAPRTSNDVATGVMGNSYASVTPGGLKLSGDGEIIAVCDTGLDTGDPATIHPDFAGRVVAIKSYPVTPDWSTVVTNVGANDGPSDL